MQSRPTEGRLIGAMSVLRGAMSRLRGVMNRLRGVMKKRDAAIHIEAPHVAGLINSTYSFCMY